MNQNSHPILILSNVHHILKEFYHLKFEKYQAVNYTVTAATQDDRNNVPISNIIDVPTGHLTEPDY